MQLVTQCMLSNKQKYCFYSILPFIIIVLFIILPPIKFYTILRSVFIKNSYITISLPPYVSYKGTQEVLVYIDSKFNDNKLRHLIDFTKLVVDIYEKSTKDSSLRPIYLSLPINSLQTSKGIYKFRIPDVSKLYNRFTIWKINLNIIFSKITLAEFKIRLTPDIRLWAYPENFDFSENNIKINILPINLSNVQLIPEFAITTKVKLDFMFYFINTSLLSNRNGIAYLNLDVNNYFKSKILRIELNSGTHAIELDLINNFPLERITTDIDLSLISLFKNKLYLSFCNHNEDLSKLSENLTKYSSNRFIKKIHSNTWILNNYNYSRNLLFKLIRKLSQRKNLALELWTGQNILMCKIINKYQLIEIKNELNKIFKNLTHSMYPYIVARLVIPCKSKNTITKNNSNNLSYLKILNFVILRNENLFEPKLYSYFGNFNENYKICGSFNECFYNIFSIKDKIYNKLISYKYIISISFTLFFILWNILIVILLYIILLLSQKLMTNDIIFICYNSKLLQHSFEITYILYSLVCFILVYLFRFDFKQIVFSNIISLLFSFYLYFLAKKILTSELITKKKYDLYINLCVHLLFYLSLCIILLLQHTNLGVNFLKDYYLIFKFVFTLPIITYTLYLTFISINTFKMIEIVNILSSFVIMISVEVYLLAQTNINKSDIIKQCNHKKIIKVNNSKFLTFDNSENQSSDRSNNINNNFIYQIRYKYIIVPKLSLIMNLPQNLIDIVIALANKLEKIHLLVTNRQIFLISQTLNVKNFAIRRIIPITNILQLLDLLIEENNKANNKFSEKLACEIIFRILKHKNLEIQYLRDNELKKIEILHAELLKQMICEIKTLNSVNKVLLEYYRFIHSKLEKLIYIDPLVNVHIKPLFETINKTNSEILHALISKFVMNFPREVKLADEILNYIDDDGEIILKGSSYKRFYKLRDNIFIDTTNTNLQIFIDEIVINRSKPLLVALEF